MLRFLSFALVFCASLSTASGADADDLTVFAAASLKDALDQVIANYEVQENVGVTASYAGSSTLARQIEFGAPADLFISANEAWMDRLQDTDKIENTSRVRLLGNRLVLIAPASNAQDVDLTSPSAFAEALGGGRLAMALVDAVPAGIYGKQALVQMGLWGSVSNRVAQTDNVRAALALVSLDAAQMGIVYATDAKAEPRVAVIADIPADSYPDIIYPAALVVGGREEAAQGFLDYLQTPEAHAVFDTFGFMRPAE